VAFLRHLLLRHVLIPEVGGYSSSTTTSSPCDPLKTPQHIAPVWYFTSYYSVLRAVQPCFNCSSRGVLAMGAAVLILFFLPWLRPQPGALDPLSRDLLQGRARRLFVVAFLILGYLGTETTTVWGQFDFRRLPSRHQGPGHPGWQRLCARWSTSCSSS